jgi:hypothetical protein
LLDADLRIADRLPAPRSPTGLTVSEAGDIFVCGELSPTIARYRADETGLRRTGSIAIGAGRGLRDVTAGPGDRLYAVDERAGRLLTFGGAGAPPVGGEIVAERSETPVCVGPIRVARVGPVVLVDCVVGHAVAILRVDRRGLPTPDGALIRHDGPIWAFDATVVATALADQDLVIAVGGVEDHPLDRTIGSFGYIDSFLTLYRVPLRGRLQPVRVTATNLSALGVVTPKVIALEAAPDGGLRAQVTGYGSDARVTLSWPRSPAIDGAPAAAVSPFVPGTTSMVGRADGTSVFADPLLDAWVVSGPTGITAVPVEAGAVGDGRDGRDGRARGDGALARLGEALFFTTLMAPWNSADGPSSRFTCETCHFEGYVDGRTHHTGRGDVRATTKPLRGLFNNRPHFSRALDPDLTTMVNNEFRVAGASSGRDPWFDLSVDDFPWLRHLKVDAVAAGGRTRGSGRGTLPAQTLRRALMSFLMDWTHLPNPAVTPGASFTAEQRRGAEVFRDRCEGCHQARLVSDVAASRMPFERWERLVLSEEGPLIWGMAEYRKTGIVPYVHDQGARVPSLRRLYKKVPYFTNGSAHDLAEVAARARFGDGAFVHDGAPADAPPRALTIVDAAHLRAFLDLL